MGAEFEGALDIAADLHGEETRDNGGSFLDGHIHPVALRTIQYGTLQEVSRPRLHTLAVAAVMHDSVENTDGLTQQPGGYTLKQCEADFGSEVVAIVDPLTNRQKREPFEVTLGRIMGSKDVAGALAVKVFDRTSNLDSSGAMLTARRDKAERKTDEAETQFLPVLYEIPDGNLLAAFLRASIKRVREGLRRAA